MDTILKPMLLGTSKSGAGPAPANGDVEELVARAAPPDAETQLLLAAGAWSVYAQAGYQPVAVEPPPRPAPQQDQPTPSVRAARLLEELFTGPHRDLLPEALTLLHHAGLRLPDELLATALEDRDPLHHPKLAAVLGERGRWLSQFNPAWSWATSSATSPVDVPPEDAEETWDSGTIDQREAILQRIRQQDPAQARAWLKQSWPSEKADHRGRLLAVLTIGLSHEDEPFLEETLGDRAMRVRAQAATLLARLPDSAFLQRTRDVVQPCLTYAPPPTGKLGAKLKALIGHTTPGELTASPPHDVDSAWKKAGIIAPPPQGVGPRAWWLSRMLGLIPPDYWCTHFGLTPAELLACQLAEEWETAVIVGWTQAAVLHVATDWLPALWDRWMGPSGLREDERLVGAHPAELLGPMLAMMSPAEATPRIERLIHEGRVTPFGWLAALEYLAQPWSAEVAQTYLRHVRDRARQAAQVANVELQSLALAARALPPASFDAALAEWSLPEGDDYQLQHWRREVDRFTEIVLLRQRLTKEISGL